MLSAFLERLLALSPPGGAAAQQDAPSTDAPVRVCMCVFVCYEIIRSLLTALVFGG